MCQLAARRHLHWVSAVKLNMATGLEERLKEEVRVVGLFFLYAAEICRQIFEVHWGRSDECGEMVLTSNPVESGQRIMREVAHGIEQVARRAKRLLKWQCRITKE